MQRCLEKLNCVDGGPKSIKKQKKCPKKRRFLRITASLTYFFGNFDPRLKPQNRQKNIIRIIDKIKIYYSINFVNYDYLSKNRQKIELYTCGLA